ncbi:MAG: SRPBCC family protein [Polyangiaceae bacterium]|nr:SRPBCC family protein [Polyangiaceae bacterium]
MKLRRPHPSLRALFLSVVLGTGIAGGQEGKLTPRISGSVDSLVRGGAFVHSDVIESLEGRCIGGVVYAIINASPTTIQSMLTHPDQFRKLLPMTKSAEWTPLRERAGHSIRIHQGNALFDVAYTLDVTQERAGLRFALNPSQPHDLRDAWGFVRLEPLDEQQTLVTFGLMVQLGSDLLANLFEKRIQRTLSTLPSRLRSLVVVDPSGKKM